MRSVGQFTDVKISCRRSAFVSVEASSFKNTHQHLKLKAGRAMTGSGQSVKNLFMLVAAILAIRCSGGSQAVQTEEQEQKPVTSEDYEKGFKPSDYDPSVESILQQLRRTSEPRPDTVTIRGEIPPDTVQGYRVQLMSTANIEEATQLRDSVSLFLPNHWAYVVYQTPYYKVRVGDFLSRIEANRMSSFIQELGFTDAWVVPDRVLKPPPPKFLPPIIPDFRPEE